MNLNQKTGVDYLKWNEMKRNAANDGAEGEAVLEADSEAGSSRLWPCPRGGG